MRGTYHAVAILVKPLEHVVPARHQLWDAQPDQHLLELRTVNGRPGGTHTPDRCHQAVQVARDGNCDHHGTHTHAHDGGNGHVNAKTRAAPTGTVDFASPNRMSEHRVYTWSLDDVLDGEDATELSADR